MTMTYKEWQEVSAKQLKKDKMFVCMNCGAINDYWVYSCQTCQEEAELRGDKHVQPV